MPALQLTIIKHAENIDSKSAVSPTIDVLKKVSSIKSIYFGSALDSPSHSVIAVIWDAFSSSLDFVKSSTYPAYVDALAKIAVEDEKPKTTHCLLSDNPAADLKAVFDSPAIEMAPLKLKADKIWQHYENFKRGGQIIAKAKGNIAQFQQPQVEDPVTQWSLVSWTSVETHLEFNSAPEFPEFLELVAPNVDMPGPPPIIHVCLKPVVGSL